MRQLGSVRSLLFLENGGTLSCSEKQVYPYAVPYWTTTPSRLRDNGTVYDVFTWTHDRYANLCKDRCFGALPVVAGGQKHVDTVDQ